MFYMVSPEFTMETYARSVGIILVLDGLSRLVEVHQKKKELENE